MRPIANGAKTHNRESFLVLSSRYVCAQALCAAVVLPDVLQTMALVFSGADVMCATGDPTVSTPYLLAQRAGQRLQMEFLHQNKLSGKLQSTAQACRGLPCRPAAYIHLADLPFEILVKQWVSDSMQK